MTTSLNFKGLTKNLWIIISLEFISIGLNIVVTTIIFDCIKRMSFVTPRLQLHHVTGYTYKPTNKSASS